MLEQINAGIWWWALKYSSNLTVVVETEDLVQVGRAGALAYLAKYPDAKPDTCLSRAKCSMADHLRSTYGRRWDSARQAQRGNLELDEAVGVGVSDDDTAAVVAAFLRTLRPREREMLEMRLAGHSHSEIAARFGVTQSRISQILRPIGRRYLDAA